MEKPRLGSSPQHTVITSCIAIGGLKLNVWKVFFEPSTELREYFSMPSDQCVWVKTCLVKTKNDEISHRVQVANARCWNSKQGQKIPW